MQPNKAGGAPLSLSLSPCTTHTCAFCAGVFRSALIYPLDIRREKIKRAMRARRAAGLAAAADSPRIQKRKIMWRGAMITQTPEYVITANNRRIVYVNTFICLSLSLSLADAFVLYVCVCWMAGWLLFVISGCLCDVRSIAPRVVVVAFALVFIWLSRSFVRSFWGCDGPSAESLPSDCRDMRGEALMSCRACALHRRLRPNVYANDLAICTAISSCWRGCLTVFWPSVFLTPFPLAQQMVFASLRYIVRRVEHQQIDSSRPLHATSLGRPMGHLYPGLKTLHHRP
jgi:hypothetical protein